MTDENFFDDARLDDAPLDDNRLREVERRLRGVNLSPPSAQRDLLLYACGRSAGRAEMKRPTAVAIGVALVSLCVSVGLAQALIAQFSLPPIANPHGAIAARPAPAPHTEGVEAARDGRRGDKRELHVATNLPQWLAAQKNPPGGPTSVPFDASPHRVLRVADFSVSRDL